MGVDEAKLDYAFLAEFAQVQGNRLTAVGASYTYLLASGLPVAHMLSVAGRVKTTVRRESVPVEITVNAPNDAYSIEVDTELHPGDDVRPYGDNVGLIFALTMQIPIPSEGLYEVLVSVDGEQQRRLAFEVQLNAPAG